MLAALVIASMSIVMAFQLFTATARVSDRLVKETAARDLGRTLLASGTTGSGQAGLLHWTASRDDIAPGLALRHVTVIWPGSTGLAFDRYETQAAALP